MHTAFFPYFLVFHGQQTWKTGYKALYHHGGKDKLQLNGTGNLREEDLAD